MPMFSTIVLCGKHATTLCKKRASWSDIIRYRSYGRAASKTLRGSDTKAGTALATAASVQYLLTSYDREEKRHFD